MAAPGHSVVAEETKDGNPSSSSTSQPNPQNIANNNDEIEKPVEISGDWVAVTKKKPQHRGVTQKKETAKGGILLGSGNRFKSLEGFNKDITGSRYNASKDSNESNQLPPKIWRKKRQRTVGQEKEFIPKVVAQIDGVNVRGKNKQFDPITFDIGGGAKSTINMEHVEGGIRLDQMHIESTINDRPNNDQDTQGDSNKPKKDEIIAMEAT